jgi:DNA-binding transcriptional ArsR family regulator
VSVCYYIEMTKTPKQLERYFKGVANHRRIQVMRLLSEGKELTLIDISESLKANFKTISEHTNKLVKAGLVNKKHVGKYVFHSLSPYGESMVKFFTSFE